MPDAMFDDLPILGELGDALRAGMARAEAAAAPAAAAPRPRRRPRGYGWLGSLVLVGLVGTTAAAGTLTLLRGSPIPGPKAEDTQPSMAPRTDSLRVLSLRAPDPDGGHLPFALRTGESEAGQRCATVGQIDGKDFGIVGADGRFREVAPGIVDGCGAPVDDDMAVTGARIFEADRWAEVRTVVYGIGNDELRSVEVTTRGEAHRVDVHDGAFVAVVRGYPEDLDLKVQLRFPKRTVVHRFGSSPLLVLDPDGPALKLNNMGTQDQRTKRQYSCVSLSAARRRSETSSYATGPSLCTSFPQPPRNAGPKAWGPREPWFFDIRTVRQGTGERNPSSMFGNWRWTRPSRTLVWGYADPDRVRRVLVRAPGITRSMVIGPTRSFGAALPASVRPNQVRVTLVLENGTQRTFDHPVRPLGGTP